MILGRFEIWALVEAHFGLDGGAMFGVVPRPLWSREQPPDRANRIDLVCRCMLLDDGERLVLVDTGIGDKWTTLERDRFAIQRDDGIPDALQRLDRDPADVTDVIQTHLHFDHAGGLTRFDGDDVVPTYPNATLHVQRTNWEWAQAPTPRDAGSYREMDWRPYAEGAAPLDLLPGSGPVLPGIEVVATRGHTPGHQAVRVQGLTEPDVVFCGDIFPTRSHLRLPWTMGYDLSPLDILEEKRALLEESHTRGTWLWLEHDPATALAQVSFDGRRTEVTRTESVQEPPR